MWPNGHVSGHQRQTKHGRRLATLDEYRPAYRYVLGTAERQVVPAHQHYQMRLRAHFEARGVSAEWERDFIDVRWERDGQTWIGEVKLTRYLTPAEAFRVALGQLLVTGQPTSPSHRGWSCSWIRDPKSGFCNWPTAWELRSLLRHRWACLSSTLRRCNPN